MRQFFLHIALLFPTLLFSLEVEVESPCVLLMNAETGAILFERDAEAPYYPASITKIATAFYLLERKGEVLDEVAVASREAVAAISPEAKRRARYQFPSHWLEFGGSHIGLKVGEAMSLRDLLYGLMLGSGNDAANVIAEHVSGSIPQFVQALNQRLLDIGCTGTHFMNPHGLHHPEHVTTARDMAVLAREALRNRVFQEVVATRVAPRPKTNLQEPSQFRQYNKLVQPGRYYYPKAFGVKTGYTSDAGSTLVAAARDEHRTLVAVVLGASSSAQRFEDAIRLFEAGFQETAVPMVLLVRGRQKFRCRVLGGSGVLTTQIPEDFSLAFYPSERPELQCVVVWNPDLVPPIQKGECVGEVQFVDEGGAFVASTPLYAARCVSSTIKRRFQRTWSGSPRLRKFIKSGVLALLSVVLIFFLKK